MPASGAVYAASEAPEDKAEPKPPRPRRSSVAMAIARQTMLQLGKLHPHDGDTEPSERKGSVAAREMEKLHETDEFERHNNNIAKFIGAVSEAAHQAQLTEMSSTFVIVPTGRFRRRWDVVVIVFLIYTATFTPYQISFLADDQELSDIGRWWAVFALDRIVDAVFVADIVFNFRTAWFTDEGNLTFNSHEAATSYLRGWFLLDLLSVIPYGALGEIPGSGLDGDPQALRLPKLLRLFRLLKIAKVLRASRIYKRWEQQLSVKYGWIRLSQFGLMIGLLSHWFACSLHMVASFADPETVTWITEAGLEDSPASTRYSVAIYWAVMTLTTIGYGDITAVNQGERTFFVIAMLVGAGMFAYVVGTMCSLIAGLDAANLQFQMTMDAVNEYMRIHTLPKELRLRIRKYLFYVRDTQQMQLSDELIWKNLSPALCREVSMHNYGDVLRLVPQFSAAPLSFLSAVSAVLGVAVFGPQEIIFRQGAPGNVMYILKKGRVQTEKYSEPDGLRIIHTLEEGSHFGERATLFGSSRPFTARTLTFCQMSTLAKEALDPILSDHPDVWKQVRKAFLKDMLLVDMSRDRFEQLMPELEEIRASANNAGLEAAAKAALEASDSDSDGDGGEGESKGKGKGSVPMGSDLAPHSSSTVQARRRTSCVSLDPSAPLLATSPSAASASATQGARTSPSPSSASATQGARKPSAFSRMTSEEEMMLERLATHGPGHGMTQGIAQSQSRATLQIEALQREVAATKGEVAELRRLVGGIAAHLGVS